VVDRAVRLSAFGTLKLFPARGAIEFTDRFTRWLGPKLKRRHKLTLTNLRNAFPEKSEAEIEAIALESWGSIGRLAAEYVFLDELFDFDPANPKPGRIEVSGIPLFLELRDNPRPFIVFTAHTGNFELLPVASAAFGLDVTVLFRPPNNPYVAEKVFDFRKQRMGNLVPRTPARPSPWRASWRRAAPSAFWSTRSSARG
jgi:KDO2-lipid IV(A) lauroyltransferase